MYFTSRGIGVLEVNYGGSTGYGRPYRDRLRGLLDDARGKGAEVIALSRRVGVVRIDISNDDDDGTRLAAAAQGTVSIKTP